MSHLYRHPPKTGRYWLAYRYKRKLYRESLKTKDRAAAKYLQAKKDQELAHGQVIIPDASRDLSHILAEYENATREYKRPKTIADDKKRVTDFFVWAHARTSADITDKRLQEYLASRMPGITVYTANRIVIAVKAIFNFAVRRNLIPVNPVQNYKLYPVPYNPARFLSKEEFVRLLESAKQEDLYPAVVTALYTGLRQRELFTLDWQDIDFNQGIITVRNKEGFTTKSRKFRVVPLHSALKAILWPRRRASGRIFDTTNSRRVFRRIIKHAKLPGIGWHTLRHTFISRLVQEGVSLFKAAEWAGHADPKTTKRYAHLAPVKDKDIELI